MKKTTKGVSPRAVARRTFLLIYRKGIDLRIGVARGSSELKRSSFLWPLVRRERPRRLNWERLYELNGGQLHSAQHQLGRQSIIYARHCSRDAKKNKMSRGILVARTLINACVGPERRGPTSSSSRFPRPRRPNDRRIVRLQKDRADLASRPRCVSNEMNRASVALHARFRVLSKSLSILLA